MKEWIYSLDSSFFRPQIDREQSLEGADWSIRGRGKVRLTLISSRLQEHLLETQPRH